jgi:hypothetical protein
MRRGTKERAATVTSERILGQQVTLRNPTRAERDAFLETLNDAGDEAPLQAFLSRNPSFLIRLLPPGARICIYDRPKLGSEYVPDFLIRVTNSQGPHWTGIELESPTVRPLTKTGEMSAKLGHAVGQVNDWKGWLRDNVAYARSELGLKGISGLLESWVIIGRRATMNDRQQKRYGALNLMGLTVLSYDRLLDV